MSKLFTLKVVQCKYCPNLDIKHTPGAGQLAGDWRCLASDSRLIAGYSSAHSQARGEQLVMVDIFDDPWLWSVLVCVRDFHDKVALRAKNLNFLQEADQ